MKKIWEMTYPIIISIIVIGLLIFFKTNSLCSNGKFEKILDATITFSTVIEGFLGVLLGILISIKETETVKKIFDYIKKPILMYYLKESLFIGLSVIVVSASLYVDNPCRNNIFYVWAFLVMSFLLSSIRISVIMFGIIETDKTYNSTESSRIPESQAEDLQKKLLYKK